MTYINFDANTPYETKRIMMLHHLVDHANAYPERGESRRALTSYLHQELIAARFAYNRKLSDDYYANKR